MSTLTIGQVAERTGFSTSSLRYYEGIGLVPPAARTAAGYRLYDEATVDRLAFIARAKQLGCTLEEITDLVSVWDGDRCGPVQRRFHELVTAKIAETEQRLQELTRFAGQLQAAATQLGAEPIDGPCDDGCACMAPLPHDRSAPVELGPKPPREDVPIACSLSAEGVHEREREWSGLLAHVERRSPAPGGGVRLAFDAATPLPDLLRLVAAEQDCCRFFSFTVGIDADGTTLDVRAPVEAEPLVTALFGAAA
ncbi:MerR family transcriptional regulator [Iamia sp. SCSIO 61187]|uniref:MerR family transcriptional regulator n=1 Tax=Iamia sp. SCSIO 61187 TaxID=2722752 RepID=UPI001C632414|nr:MerR family transcriptional regulator [Iamia sp. SCSIO 61187]QYG92488.1 MerR family transcriptional regulator [Iamia sp. SCSIO 61187]